MSAPLSHTIKATRLRRASAALPKDIGSWRVLLHEAIQVPQEDVVVPSHFTITNLHTNQKAAKYPIPNNVPKRESAVLVLLSPSDLLGSGSFVDLNFILTMRSSKMRTHGGQMAFAGGRLDGDESPEDGASREAWEEIGIGSSQYRTIGRLRPLYSYPSKSWVTPVVALADDMLFPRIHSPKEVSSIHYLHMSQVLCASEFSHHRLAKHFSNTAGGSVGFPCFFASDDMNVAVDEFPSTSRGLVPVPYDWGMTPVLEEDCQGTLVWGLTAFIICELLARLSTVIGKRLDNDEATTLRSSSIIVRDSEEGQQNRLDSKL